MSDGQVLKLRLSLLGRPVRNYTFEKPVISVGRDPGADVYVDNPGVSRDHFRLERTEQGEYQVVDLGSANGTFVNDQMVNTAPVHNNDVIRFGKYTLWVGYESDRRSGREARPVVTPVSETMGHTVVLSRAELGSILEQERRASAARVVSVPGAPAPAPHTPGAHAPRARAGFPAWLGIAAGVLLGILLGAAVLWFLLQQAVVS